MKLLDPSIWEKLHQVTPPMPIPPGDLDILLAAHAKREDMRNTVSQLTEESPSFA